MESKHKKLSISWRINEPSNLFSPTTGVNGSDIFYYIANAQIGSLNREEQVLVEHKPVAIRKI